MAKLKAPLLSFGASGQIAKSLVYFAWKGLNVVRQHVVPANPNTASQQTQRGYVRLAVDKIHEAMAHAAIPLTEADKSANSLLGGLEATPRTWFNTLIKVAIDQQRLVLSFVPWSQGTVTPGVDQLTFALQFPALLGAAAPTDGLIYYGSSKSAMLNSVATTVVAMAAGKVIPALTTGVKYYVQFRCTAPAGAIGANSGIYSGVPT